MKITIIHFFVTLWHNFHTSIIFKH
jgi:hypothetical protein